MFFGESGEEALSKQRKGVEFVAANRQGEDCDVNSAGAEPVEQHWRDFLDYREPRFWKLSGERGQLLWQKVGRDGGNYADRERTVHGVPTFYDVAFGGFQFAENRAGAG